MCLGLIVSVVCKFSFVISGLLVAIGCSLLWADNPFDLDGYSLKKYNYDVFMFVVSWALCFLSWLAGEDAFTVLVSGVLLACFTTRRDSLGNMNLSSMAGVNMCREFYADQDHPANTAAFFNPDYAVRFAETNYTYALDEEKAQNCLAAGACMYTGIMVALVAAAYSGKDQREKSGNMVSKLLGFAIGVGVIVGSVLVLSTDAAQLDAPTYFTVIDTTVFVMLVGVYVFLSYFVNSVPMVYAASVLAAYAAMTNLSVMFSVNQSTRVETDVMQSGFVMNEAAMCLACVLCIWSAMTGFKSKTSMKIVPIAGSPAKPSR